MRSIYAALTGATVLLNVAAFAQSDLTSEIIRHLASENPAFQGGAYTITDAYTSRHNGVKHVYMSQELNGITVINTHLTAALSQNGEVYGVSHNFKPEIWTMSAPASPSLNAPSTIAAMAGRLEAGIAVQEVFHESGESKVLLSKEGGYEHFTTPRLVYWLSPENELHLAWTFDIELPSAQAWWQFICNAADGSELTRISWMTSCSMDHMHTATCSHTTTFDDSLDEVEDGTGYNVFPMPVESPNHGSRALKQQPAIALASPFGWHDTNGVPGPEYTITRGNNVYAYEDINDNNSPGQSPDGGASLQFDFPLSLTSLPFTYTEAATTNLFYVNNYIHDYLYYFGFDEPSGNFQANNYGNGGLGGDWVRAESQDGGGTNNANMATPPDGSPPRMQMYLWVSANANTSLLNINSPASIEGPVITSNPAAFGPGLPLNGITADVVLAEDITGSSLLCSPALTPDYFAGKIALVDRGECPFVQKVLAAQQAGALAVIIANNVAGGVMTMGGTSNEINIPSISISLQSGNLIKSALNAGQTVNATLDGMAGGESFKDGSFDNGIIVHEYIHGLTNRLTGGPSQSGCLGNQEQMGEGWSDWYAIAMTMDLSAPNPVNRPMGTFASSQAVTGNGIRPAPYDTSFAVNPYTYANLPNTNISVPHGVGFIFATMLWDLTWALIDEYGYDDNIDNPTAGNNVAMRLVTDALKLQPCSPGFVDGRDAILLADQINYGGANQCIIWKAFARRGLGLNADQGSSDNRSDGTPAFNLPNICTPATNPPVAAFAASSNFTCNGLVQFTDQSTDIVHFWLWDFGDGNTSTAQNPSHQYSNPGVYTVTLTVSNNIGDDILTQDALIEFSTLDAPTASDTQGCAGETVLLTAQTAFGEPAWYSSQGELLGVGNNLPYTIGQNDEILSVTNMLDDYPEIFIGPVNNSIGAGSFHSTAFVGTVDFVANEPLIIRSVWVNSNGPGVRNINLWDDLSGNGNILQTIPVNIDFTGTGRIDLDITITNPGNYSLGLNYAGLYRNNGGVNYPYSSDLLTMVGSSGGLNLYYYFYDWEVDKPNCESEAVQITVSVTGEIGFSYADEGLTVQFTPATGNNNSWFWDFGDGTTSDAQQPQHTYAVAGTYWVTLTTGDGCSLSQEINVGTTGIGSATGGAGFAVRPNPSTGLVYITPSAGAINERVTLSVHSLSGQVVWHYSYQAGTELYEANLEKLAAGMYLIHLKSAEGDLLFQSRIAITR